jgi:hypothetical protein
MGNPKFIGNHLGEGVILAEKREDFSRHAIHQLLVVEPTGSMVSILAATRAKFAALCIRRVFIGRNERQLAAFALTRLPFGSACGLGSRLPVQLGGQCHLVSLQTA